MDKILAENVDLTDVPATIANLIARHDITDMMVGHEYYHSDPDIKDRHIFFYEDGEKKIDEDATNCRVVNNWQKVLVDQKVSYLLGDPPVIQARDDDVFTQHLNEILDERWDDRLQELGKGASNKGVEWLHPYINSRGEFKFTIIKAEQCIPIYESEFEEELVAMLRYFSTFLPGNQVRVKAEWWTPSGVATYIEEETGIFRLEKVEGHFTASGSPGSWGRVPFIEFPNNEERFSDLKYYKEIVDIYDTIVSDLANDLTDIQKLIFILKGYGGQSLTEFLQNLRHYRAIQVDPDSGAGVETLTSDPPITAIDSTLDRLEENIFLFGQGVNPKTDAFGATSSGIALKFLYGLLDLKCNIMARRFTVSIQNVCWFIARYLEIRGKGTYDPYSVRVTYTKTLLAHDLEMSQIALSSMGVISHETVVSHHPWVDDAEEEMARLEEERSGRIDLSAYLDDEEDDDEDEGEKDVKDRTEEDDAPDK